MELTYRVGENGAETAGWATAAGMNGFETFWERCTRALKYEDFVWPDGLTEIKYPPNGDGEWYTVGKPGTAGA